MDVDKSERLGRTGTDQLVAVAKATFGAIPVVGAALCEAISFGVPNQQAERVRMFLLELHERLSQCEKELVTARLATPGRPSQPRRGSAPARAACSRAWPYSGRSEPTV